MNDSEDKPLPAQRPLQGPRAKNTPRWKRLSTPVVTRRQVADKQWGGAAKNERPGSQKQDSAQSLVRRKKQILKGPWAKNRRP
ncbi:MAG: hypothetical protein WA960_05100 [Tunicatimonas sp.]